MIRNDSKLFNYVIKIPFKKLTDNSYTYDGSLPQQIYNRIQVWNNHFNDIPIFKNSIEYYPIESEKV
jgi:hypothetical protein